MIDEGIREDAPAAVAPPPPLESRALPVRFTGNGPEYFRIWLLHLLLTVLSLGLYLPFAKARRLRYLCANTWIDGQALVFHGDAWRMFRGFLILVGLFGVYAIAGRFSALAGYVAFLALCGLWPALWRAGLQFRLANTSWRGMRLAFRGDLADAYSAFGLAIWPLMLMVGVQQFTKALLDGSVALAPGWAAWVGGSMAVIGGIGVVAYLVLLPLTLAKVKAYQHNHYQLAEQHTRLTVSAWRYYGLAFKTAAFVLAPTLALALTVYALGGPKALMQASASMQLGLVAIAGLLAYLIGFAALMPFFQARLQDLVWNHTRSEQLGFTSRLPFRRLAGLTLLNWFLVLITAGLYRPFAAVATWRLKVQAVQVELTGSLDKWDGRESAPYTDAAGEAAGDFFGIDLGL